MVLEQPHRSLGCLASWSLTDSRAEHEGSQSGIVRVYGSRPVHRLRTAASLPVGGRELGNVRGFAQPAGDSGTNLSLTFKGAL